MKSARILFALSLALPAAAAAQEGVATFKYTFQGKEAGPDGQAIIWFSPSAYLAQVQMSLHGGPNAGRGQGGATQAFTMKMLQKFSDPDKIYTINDDNKTYSVMDQSKNRDSTKDETYTAKKLGTMQIAGLSCQNALITSSKGSQMEVCVTHDVNMSGNWLAAMTRQQGRTGNWGKALTDAGMKAGFPIRWTAKSREGTGEAVMELVKLEKKAVPASMFQIPAGYRETGGGLVTGGVTPEQQKQIDDALSKLTPEQRKAYEDMMKGREQQEKKQ